jgi:hypothetical protein
MINSGQYDHVIADEFEILVDTKPPSGAAPAIGLMITPVNGETFIVPMTYEAALGVSTYIRQTLRKVAPQLFVR